MTMPPAAFMRATISESCGAICPASSGEPMLSGSPATGDSSLMAIGKPCIQPMLRPCASIASRSSAWASRPSCGSRPTSALTFGFSASMRAR